MALVGYGRVSSVGQSLEVQLEKLGHCDKLFQDKHSGASGRRPSLHACLDYVREGDTLVITRLDRLARSTSHLCQIADDLARKHVGLQVLDQHLDTSDATGRLLFKWMGFKKPRHGGVRFGPKKRLTLAQVSELRQRRAQGELIKTLMQDYGLSKASVYRYLATRDVSL
jgi:DNA invertase Pin-like site-specific DNA recombinase